MENPTAYLIENTCAFFLQKPNENTSNVQKQKNAATLVRVHHEKLDKIGDISLPTDIGIWRNYFRNVSCLREEAFAMFSAMDLESAERTQKAFLNEAANWTYPLERITLQNERCALHLQRNAVTSQCLRQVLQSRTGCGTSYGQLRKNPSLRICLQKMQNESVKDLSLHRAKLIEKTLHKLLQLSSWTIVDDASEHGEQDVLRLQVVSVAAKGVRHKSEPEPVSLKCGIVCDSTTGKLAQLETSEYINLRSNDMRLMAMHKYGIRVKNDKRFCELIERLGAAAVTVDLLEVKHSSPVQIIRNGQGSTKGASFILYNSARLESLLQAFNERVQSEVYGQLPAMEDVDFALLTEEEEWQLVYGYIFAFPHLIESCLEHLAQGMCATHLIVRFISDFVSIFSVYYRRIKILTEKRDRLMPFVYARVYLIKAVREVLNRALYLLDIEPVLFM